MLKARISRKSQKRLALIVAATAASTGLAVGIQHAQADFTYTINSQSDLETISTSGSSALKNWDADVRSTDLSPSSTFTLTLQVPAAVAGGTNSITWFAANTATQTAQLAPSVLTSPITVMASANLSPAGSYSGNANPSSLNFEYHVSGSVEGIIELAGDQFAGSGIGQFNDVARNPSSGNPIYLNHNAISAIGTPVNGFQLSGSFASGNGQAKVQIAQSDVVPSQGFSSGGTAAGSLFLTPGQSGYGKGNAALVLPAPGTSGLGYSNSRQQLVDQSFLNMGSNTVVQVLGATQTAGVGAWNTGGTNNLNSTPIAITATIFAANPGTGLDKLDRKQAQWLQAASRFSNGATFNMSERDVYSGTRNTAALNTGIDPSFAVGLNDGGNGNAFNSTQSGIGAGIKYTGKTSGGSGVLPTVTASRMAIGPIGLSDAFNNLSNGSSAPMRGLAYGSFDAPNGGTYYQPSLDNISNNNYAIWQTEQLVTVKAPDGTYTATNSGTAGNILGDTNASGDVNKVINNVTDANANWAQIAGLSDSADALASQHFVLPSMMSYTKNVDGGPVTAQTRSANYAAFSSTYASAFNVADPTTIYAGSASIYNKAGKNNSGTGGVTLDQIPITDATVSGTAHAGGNWLFGNFNQNGIRDYSAVIAAQSAQAALYDQYGTNGVDANLGFANSSSVTGGASVSLNGALASGLGAGNGLGHATKGDLIVLGDYAGVGRFDGNSLYSMAVGASLADSTNSTTLTLRQGTNGVTGSTETLGDAIGRGVLLKNKALDTMNTAVAGWTPANGTTAATTAVPWQQFQRTTAYGNPASSPLAAAALLRDPTGQFAFSKYDVLHNGTVDYNDVAVVHKFLGQDYSDLATQVAATVWDPTTSPQQADPTGTNHTALNLVSFNLTSAKLFDDGTTTIGPADENAEAAAAIASGGMLGGDFNFDGKVDGSDLVIFNNGWFKHESLYSLGDINGDGVVDGSDLVTFNNSWFHSLAVGAITPAEFAQGEAVLSAIPEPASLSLLAVGAGALMARRRARRASK